MNKFDRTQLSLLVGAPMMICALLLQSAEVLGEPSNTVQEIEEVLVTGSHIRRSGYDGRSPIQVIDRDQMIAEGASTIIDVAKNLTVNTGSFITQETGGLIGTAQFNVRGLGTGSTLTLINGRRAGKSATADGNGNQFFDVNQLPLMMIERMDVQVDGASAIYGSDAVGGVVNIITRKGFEGAEFMVRAEDSTNSAYSISGALGTQSDSARFSMYGTYYKQDRNNRSDFSWLTDRIDPEARFYSSNGGPGNYRLALLDPITGDYLGGSGSEQADVDCLAAGGVKTATSSRCRANFLDQVSIIPEEERIQIFAEGDLDVNDSIKLFAEAHFSNNEINRTQGTSLFDKGLADGRLLVPANHPFNFWVDDGSGGISYIDPASWDNNVHTAVPLNVRGRPFGAEEFFSGPFDEDKEFRLNYFRALGGIEIQLNDSWGVNASYVYNKSEWRQATPYKYVAANLNAALLDGSYNPFGTRIVNPSLVSPKDGISSAGLTENVLRQITYTEVNEAESEQTVFDVVLSGEAFELDGGTVGMAFGLQYRDETYFSRQDSLTQAGLGGRNGESVADIVGDQDVWAAFAEVLIPLTADLEVSAALRHEAFGGGIGGTTDPKLSVRWQANEDLALRGSFGTSFQAPSVRQTGESTGSAFINDPFAVDGSGTLGCQGASTQANTIIRTGGDDGLEPQSAENYNLGLVFAPTDDVKMSVDYWHFTYEDLIRADANPQSIIDNDCAGDGVANDPRVVRSSSGQLRGINVSFINAGELETDGFDLALTYHLGDTDFGDWRLGTKATFVNSFDLEDSNGATIDGAGSRNFSNAFSSVPEWRGNATINWNLENHSANATVRYISGYDNDQLDNSGAVENIENWTTFDLRYGYAFENIFDYPATISVGVNNVFDEDPPSLGENVRPGYDENVHDVRGRLMYAEIRMSF
jgi:iron complex outermembrane receptor protein